MIFEPQVVVPATRSAHPRWFVCAENQVLLRTDGAGLEQLPTTAELERCGVALDEPQMVGTLDGDETLAVPWSKTLTVPAGFELVGLRSLWSRLDEQLFVVAGRANQLSYFASTHRFCGRCGTRNTRHPKERAMRCGQCGLVSYPRISPAIITLVRRGDEALLANHGRYDTPMFSTLAGFAEIGESLEETLSREVKEETGVTVRNVRYFGSQPWPFPQSLMIGFTAEWAGGEVQVDGEEIKEARFFKATELPPIPPRLSIARRLIDAWVTEVTGHPAP